MKPADISPAAVGLTDRQRACLAAIELHASKTRTMPSVEELRLVLGYTSKSGVLRLLHQLEQRGHIARLPNRARAIRLLGRNRISCPDCRAKLQQKADVS